MKNKNLIYLTAFLLSLSLILLLEAGTLRFLAEDIKVPQKEEVEIELLLSAADNPTGDNDQPKTGEKFEQLERKNNDDRLEAEVDKNVEADKNSLEKREETKKQNNKISEEENKKPEKEQKENNKTEIREEIAAEKNQFTTESKDSEPAQEIQQDTEKQAEKENEPPAWLKKLESKAEDNSSDVEEKDNKTENKREEFDLEKYLAELEKKDQKTKSNSDQNKENSESKITSEINNNYPGETAEQSKNNSKKSVREQNNENKKVEADKKGQEDKNVYDLRTGNNEQIKMPAVKNYSKPVYPANLRKRNIEGEVIVSLRIDKKGNAHDLEINKSSGFSSFDQAALKAVSGWEFQAAVKGEQKVQVIVKLPIRFELK